MCGRSNSNNEWFWHVNDLGVRSPSPKGIPLPSPFLRNDAGINGNTLFSGCCLSAILAAPLESVCSECTTTTAAVLLRQKGGGIGIQMRAWGHPQAIILKRCWIPTYKNTAASVDASFARTFSTNIRTSQTCTYINRPLGVGIWMMLGPDTGFFPSRLSPAHQPWYVGKVSAIGDGLQEPIPGSMSHNTTGLSQQEVPLLY